MKGEKEQPDFIAEAFKMKIISAFPPANEQMIIHVLSLIYYRHERFISFRLCNNNPPGISILKINYITILAAPNRRYICKIYKWCFRQRSNSFFAFFLGIHLTNNFIICKTIARPVYETCVDIKIAITVENQLSSNTLKTCSLIRLKNSITKDTTRQKNRLKSQLRYLGIA